MKKRRKPVVLAGWLLVFLMSFGSVQQISGQNGYMDAIPVQADTSADEDVYVSGQTIGIYMETKGVLVVDAGEIRNENGLSVKPAEHIVKQGDYLMEAEGSQLKTKQQLVELVNQSNGKKLEFSVLRDGETIRLSMTPIRTEDGSYKLGIWVRDNLQGIGTVTYVKEDGSFGALGHGISDVDTGGLLQLKDGEVYRADILSVTRGENGKPGELQGVIDYRIDNKMGTIVENQKLGIFGKINASDIYLKKVPVGKKEEITTGAAEILSCVDGTVQQYQVEITDIDWNHKDSNKCFTIRVTDENLLKKTGGIVQGMSGSPILQNGKLVGAVTHVLVHDSASGYGIFIENMLGKQR